MPAVKLSGVKYVLSQLSQVSPEARKNITKEVKRAARPIVSKARGFVPSSAPLSGWESSKGLWGEGARRFNSGEMKAGIGFSSAPTKPNRNGYSYIAYFYNKSVAGSIYETAGRKNPNGRQQAPSVQHYANAGTPFAKADYKVRNSDKAFSQSANPNAGAQFIGSMGKLYQVQRLQGQGGRVSRKANGRLMFKAVGEDQGKVRDAIVKTYADVVSKFNKGAL